MARHADPDRIAAARRAAAIARLIGAGELPDRAVALVARWEATLADPPARSDWEALDAWLAARRPPARGPPAR